MPLWIRRPIPRPLRNAELARDQLQRRTSGGNWSALFLNARCEKRALFWPAKNKAIAVIALQRQFRRSGVLHLICIKRERVDAQLRFADAVLSFNLIFFISTMAELRRRTALIPHVFTLCRSVRQPAALSHSRELQALRWLGYISLTWLRVDSAFLWLSRWLVTPATGKCCFA